MGGKTDDAEDADRQAALGTLTAAGAHRINNPLAWVLGNLAYARRQLSALHGEPAMLSSLREALDEAYEGADTVRRVVADLKPFSPGEDRDDILHPHVSSAATSSVQDRKYRILIVDDEPLVLRAMRRVLDAHDVVTLERGEDAVDLLARGEPFDIILCDLMMPMMTGMEVYDRLRALGSGLEQRVVFVTGGAVTNESRDFLARVPNLRFQKPVDPRKMEGLLAIAALAGSD